jgi:hypothetical protein
MVVLELFFDREYQGHLDLGTHGTVYSKGTRDAEAFLRPLWGLGPYAKNNSSGANKSSNPSATSSYVSKGFCLIRG